MIDNYLNFNKEQKQKIVKNKTNHCFENECKFQRNTRKDFVESKEMYLVKSVLNK